MADVEDGGDAGSMEIGAVQPAVPHGHLVDAVARGTGDASHECWAGGIADVEDADVRKPRMDLVQVGAIDEYRMHPTEAADGLVDAGQLYRVVWIGQLNDVNAAIGVG